MPHPVVYSRDVFLVLRASPSNSLRNILALAEAFLVIVTPIVKSFFYLKHQNASCFGVVLASKASLLKPYISVIVFWPYNNFLVKG